eukprot:5255850-Pyramimonas_sp.AAC.1
MAGTEDTADKCVKCVEDTFGKCKLKKHTRTNCAVIYTKDEDCNVTLDQYEYIKQLRPIQDPELTGADAALRQPRWLQTCSSASGVRWRVREPPRCG